MATPTKTLRLRPGLQNQIDRIARRSRRSFSQVTQDLLEEALRMRECPGISKYSQEIADEIQENAALTREALNHRSPGLVRPA
ncbi:MAG: hypothetical protein HY766_11375 [candidate division NC10 bacterium]|nr:hypothetical protein [candidate division NC10 bacterium]